MNDRVIVKLDRQEDHTVTPSGLINPLFERGESEGGRPIAVLSGKEYLSTGTVVAVSPLAAKKFSENNTPLKDGDRVMVPISAVSPHYQFFPKRDALVLEFEGYVSLPYTLIEAKYND